MKLANIYFGLLLAPMLACSDTQDVSTFQYGAGQPGANLPEGGEIRHERVNIHVLAPNGPISWIQVYQFTGSPATAPFPAPDPTSEFFPCVDERESATWPFTPIEGVTYLTLPKVELSGQGINGKLSIPLNDPPNDHGNSTFRHHDFTYGGGASSTCTPEQGCPDFNSTLTADASTPGAEYTLDIGKGEPMTYFMPDTFATAFNIGMVDKVTFPGGQPLTATWTPPAQDFGSSGLEHTKKTYFNFLFFADPTAENAPQFICFPPDGAKGEIVVPKAVVDALPPGGLIVHADLGHYMEARQTCDGTTENGCQEGVTETRRFDLVSIFCNISLYEKQ